MSIRDKLSALATAVLTLCAVTVTALVVRRELFPPGGGDPPGRVSAWREYAERGQMLGNPAAPVTIVVFSDYQCPACRVLDQQLKELRASHPDSVRVLFRHYPLDSHPQARNAALSSECAAAQGRFEEYHRVLFAAQDSIGAVSWSRLGRAAGLDSLRFARCLAAADSSAVLRDLDAGRKLDVRATPTLLINDVRVQGAPPPGVLDRMVRDALASAREGRA